MELSNLDKEIKDYDYTQFLKDFYNNIYYNYNKEIIDTWNGTDTYDIGDKVGYKKKNIISIYESLVDNNINHKPTENDYWQRSNIILENVIFQSEIEKNISLIKEMNNTQNSIIDKRFNKIRSKIYLQYIIGLYVASITWQNKFCFNDKTFGIIEQDKLEDASIKNKIPDLINNDIDLLFMKDNPFALRILFELRKIKHPSIITSRNRGFDNLY